MWAPFCKRVELHFGRFCEFNYSSARSLNCELEPQVANRMSEEYHGLFSMVSSVIAFGSSLYAVIYYSFQLMPNISAEI